MSARARFRAQQRDQAAFGRAGVLLRHGLMRSARLGHTGAEPYVFAEVELGREAVEVSEVLLIRIESGHAFIAGGIVGECRKDA